MVDNKPRSAHVVELEDLKQSLTPAQIAELQANRVKVERTCPRCNTNAYHLGNDMGLKNRIACVNCGHVWTGRITREELA